MLPQCDKQFPHRHAHPADMYFEDEGWGGRCGNNEVTCHLSGFGQTGKITFDWKHFPFEDYDQWLFGTEGTWQANATAGSYPDILVIHVGLHTCVHAWKSTGMNYSMIEKHTHDIVPMLQAVHSAIHRTPADLPRTTVIIQLPGRAGNSNINGDACSRSFNRILAAQAHRFGFAVLEREEIERRLLWKSEYYPDHRTIKPNLHLENPGPNIVGTSLLGLISCLARNGTNEHPAFRTMDAVSTFQDN